MSLESESSETFRALNLKHWKCHYAISKAHIIHELGGLFEPVLPQLTVKSLMYQVVQYLVNSNIDLSTP